MYCYGQLNRQDGALPNIIRFYDIVIVYISKTIKSILVPFIGNCFQTNIKRVNNIRYMAHEILMLVFACIIFESERYEKKK